MMGLTKLGRKAHANMVCAKSVSAGASAGIAGLGFMASAAPVFADETGWDVGSGGVDGMKAGGASAGGGDGGSIGQKILEGIQSVFDEIKIFIVALLVLCAVIYALVSVFSSRPEIWRGKIVYVGIVLVCILCIGTILGFITNAVGTGDYVYMQDIPVNQ